jgi:hypothetical protein
MKSTLIASIPALVLIFALTCGFGTFHVMLQQAEASGSDNCDNLRESCNQAKESESIACASGNAERCESAKANRRQVCGEYRDTCW